MRADDPVELAESRPTAREAPELARELLSRYRAHRPVRAVMVTDLVDPRAAFWRFQRPLPPTPEQAARMRDGRLVHERLGRLLGPVSSREVRVRRDGVVGRMDLFDGRPVELKSTESPPRADDDPRRSRPSYVEQVAMYSALVGSREGRLVVVAPPEGGAPRVLVWDFALRDVDAVWREVQSRALLLRTAREAGSSLGLPRCAFYDRGCPYRTAAVCDCRGDEAPLGNEILGELSTPTARPEEAERISNLLTESSGGPAEVGRFYDLAYPRRSYFDERFPPEEPTAPTPAAEADETWSAVRALLEEGPPGEWEARYAPSAEPAEPVECWRGEPCLVKTTKAAGPPAANRLPTERPHYVLELGLRCGALGASGGWLVLGMEQVPSSEEWIHAIRVEFGAPGALRSLVERRRAALAGARARNEPATLPACPRWMFERCPHRATCGCGAL